MKVFVYGTLQSNQSNHGLLIDQEFVEEKVVNGYKLYYSHGGMGFPVAKPCPNSSVKGEVYDIKDCKQTLARLDRLEGEGSMYIRTDIGDDTFMYVGPEGFWDFDNMVETPIINNTYEWS